MGYHLQVLFIGWGTIVTYPTKQAAEEGMIYWQERTSWPLRIVEPEKGRKHHGQYTPQASGVVGSIHLPTNGAGTT